jgi:hypothetical protein
VTYFLNFRSAGVGGAVIDPYLLEGDGTTDPPSLSVVPWARVPSVLAGRNILFATHGFNVNYPSGTKALGMLDAYLKLPPPNLFIGMLWPGDAWIPVVDYPFEGDVAIDCGQRLAAFCNSWGANAQSFSFASHSLGVRFVLEAMMAIHGRIDTACICAGAINRDCLTAEYAEVLRRVATVSLLSSHSDDVLKLAFTVGDPFADILHDDHTPFTSALGYDGPRMPAPAQILGPWQIADADGYGHGNYLPTSDGDNRWVRVAEFIRMTFLRLPSAWPAVG